METISITREPKYAEKIRRWEAFWSLEDVGRPLWMIPTSAVAVGGLMLPGTMPRILQDKELQCRAELMALKWRESIDIDDDFVPHMQPQGGVSVFASAFGCDVQFFEHTLPWAHPLITANDPPERVYAIEPPEVTAGQLGQMLEFTDHFVAESGGRYPIALTDTQGPLDTAYLVWESSSFMTAMYTNPKEVHHLMRLVTDLIIRYVKEQRSRSPEFLPCHVPPAWLPDGRGVSISDDGLAVISARLYEEFCLPYVNELSEEFGGMLVHSCGNFVHQFDNLRKVRDLRGINFGATETPFEAVWEAFGGKTAILPHLGLNNDPHFENNVEYMEHVMSVAGHNRGLCLVVLPDQLDASTFQPDVMDRFVSQVQDSLRISR
jgi:hypothetical protein